MDLFNFFLDFFRFKKIKIGFFFVICQQSSIFFPGELEFSDQDNFSIDGPTEVRVKPPPGFNDDLDSLIGSKFQEANLQQNRPQLQSSLGQFQNTANFNPFANLLQGLGGQQQQPQPSATPTLPSFNPLAGLSQEQLQRLALLQYLQNMQNPMFGGLGGLGGFGLQHQQQQQIFTTSTPVIKTETLYATSTIPLFVGAKKFFTTLIQAIGVTTKTEYEVATQTVPSANNGLLGGLNFQQQPQQQQFRPQLQPGLTVTSEAVIRNTVVPSTVTKEIRITFRNTPTLTTLTSTTMVSTQITEYVTKTVRAQATLASGNGQFGGFNLAALLG